MSIDKPDHRRCWIEGKTFPHSSGDHHLYIIKAQFRTKSSDEWICCSRDGTGDFINENPEVLWAYIQQQGWEFVPELSDWRPPS